MEENDSKQSVKCTNCNAELPEGTRFCTECGKPIEQVPAIDEPANDEKSPEEGDISQKSINCPECHAEVQPGSKFCMECGAKIEAGSKMESTPTPVQETRCPECQAEMPPGTRFCTECGTSLGEKAPTNAGTGQELKKPRETGKKTGPVDETIDSVVESGKGLMKGLGGFLNKTAEDLDKNLKHAGKSSQNSKGGRKPIKPPIKKEKNTGYLICDECSGYYQLQPGEVAADFDDKCECGGRLRHHKSLPEDSS
jgi:predicted amidophosphoribosyltransferase